METFKQAKRPEDAAASYIEQQYLDNIFEGHSEDVQVRKSGESTWHVYTVEVEYVRTFYASRDRNHPPIVDAEVTDEQ